MIIDAHAHACGDYLKAEIILEFLDKNNVDQVILCPGESDTKKNRTLPNLSELYPDKDYIYLINKVISFVTRLTGVSAHIEKLNQYVYTLCQNNPERLLQAYWVNPNNKQVIQNMDRDFTKYNFKLLKMHQCWTYFKFNSGIITEITNWALKNNIPIFVHIKSRKDVLDFIQLAKERQNNVLIVAHLIGIEEFIKDIEPLRNVYFEISSPQLIPLKKLNTALENFGSERLLLGSDIPYGKNNLRLNIERVTRLDITQTEKDNILGNNMKKLLHKNC
jgi:uncharacterized protein